MKQFLTLLFCVNLSFCVYGQEEINEDRITAISDKLKEVNNKVIELEQKAKRLNYKISQYNQDASKEYAVLHKEDEQLLQKMDSITGLLANQENELLNLQTNFKTFKSDMERHFVLFKKSNDFKLFLEAIILILIIGTISFLLYRFSRKNRRELIELKREVDLEIKTAEKEAISEIRNIKEEMKKYKTAEALKHGPAYISLKEEFITEIQDAKEIFVSRVNELGEKYEKETVHTKERIDKEVMDFKHQIQKEIDELLEKIEQKEEKKE